ncbi:ShlB/FhaC/HecB family hemolysin secretion/activation protein [Hwanghaeella grinnelliae]|uniref:ShlB/FhaC/HecB family hemolysin secretion/activation protein n=1 Tax=Hwanghaeella grinnelliae TaxID=2500179 RepID=A0A437QWF2_9PROT|nr:ShlB/FhaC/HecB family hemolysin secretion/activation protein [Hwanghaeella grinnelliae]RVU38857.1 ShlB/FhaC/HecB family hemolysin secretion/activation protein [Hwanghaeella grinnelliae]
MRQFIPSMVYIGAGAYILCAALAGPVQAQRADSNDVIQIKRQIEEAKPAREERQQEIETETVVEPEAVAPEDGVSFILGGVVVEGSSVFEPSRFTEFYTDLIARQVTSADIDRVAKAITDFYKQEGFVLTRAEVRPQEVASGVLTIDVIEGYIAEVAIQGDGIDANRFQSYFTDLLEERPTRLSTMERALYLTGDLPGYWVAKSTVTEGAAPGAYILNVTIGYDAFDFYTYLDNRGTPESGRLESWTAVGANDTLGLNERLQLGFFTNPLEPAEVLYGEFAWTQPVGNAGTTVTTTLSATETDSGGSDRNLDLESKSRNATLDVIHPLLRGAGHSIWATGSFDFMELREQQRGIDNFDDQTRVLRAGLRYYGANRWSGDHFLQLEVSKGLEIFGSSETGDANLSRADAEPDFTKVEFFGRRVQRMGNIFSVEVSGKAQWSDAPLLTTEEYSLGGAAFGRAYDYGELEGEGGIAGLAEARVDLGQFVDFMSQIQFYGFYDVGTVFRDNFQSDWESLASAGGGVRLGAYGLYTDLQIAKPLTRRPSGQSDDDPRYMFSVSLGL